MKSRTLTDIIYESLKDDIVQLRIKPGEKLSEMQLAERYEVSRAPIRQVIARLQQEKLVIVRPQIGTIVSPISLKKARDTLQVRILLEPYAAEVAAQTMGKEDRQLLYHTFKHFESTHESDVASMKLNIDTDTVLHETIWKWCGNEEIYSILRNYGDEIYRIRISSTQLAHRLVPTAVEMKEIFHALQDRNAERARTAMYEHIANIKNTVETFLQEGGDPD
jgi:DNA-binding GntR family transcriptional regulator